MNPLVNPLITIPVLKNFILDHGRLQRLNQTQIQKFRDKEFRKIVKYAYNVPFYHDKYKKAGLHPSDIRGLKDIEKLPLITKEDLVKNFPDRIIPTNYNKKKGFVICTGGTTGKPVSIYTDFITMGKSTGLLIRELNHFNLHWKKSRFVHIGNFNQYRIDKISQENFSEHIESFISFKNRLNLDVGTPLIKMIELLDKFRPEIIMAYPAVFQHLAFLKRKGKGNNIKPKILWTGGAILDDYTKRYVEDAFNCALLNIYPSVEAGADIAFECLEGTWHINYDFFELEAIDDDGCVVAPGERGHVVLTRLWGNGTPIIRYVGMEDWVRLSDIERCNCGLKTPTIIDGVEGRNRANIVLPNGKIFPPGAFCFIEPVLQELNTFKVLQYQIVQKSINEIQILIVIDEDLRKVGPSVDVIFEIIEKKYKEKVGPDVIIDVKEVKEIKHRRDASKPPPIVVSNVSQEEGYKALQAKN
jgi:phenylacetate-CoA ligase